MWPDALILAFSAVAVVISAASLTRSAPALLRSECEEARARSLKAEQEVQALRSVWEAARAEFTTILGAVEEERERAAKDRNRARAERQRAEQGPNGPVGPEDRASKLNRLRRESGVLSGV